MIIPHKHRVFINNNDIEVLFLGTFNPETTFNDSTFFYGRSHNYFWKLMPVAFDGNNLRNIADDIKMSYLIKNKIGLLDMISSVKVNDEQELKSYGDAQLDRSYPQWNEDIFKLIDTCQNLKTIFFTRKTFQGIPNIRKRFTEIEKYAVQKGIIVELLVTPSRFTNEDKQNSWIKSISIHKSRAK